MAMIQVCDKCGEPYDDNNFDQLAALYRSKNGNDAKKIDLCRNCQKELVDWYTNKKAKVVKY